MKKLRLVPAYLFLPVLFFALVPLLGLWYRPELIPGQLWVLPVWLIILSGISYFIQKFIAFFLKNKTVLRWLWLAGSVAIVLIGWFFSLRLSSMVVGPEQAWDTKWINLLINILYLTGDWYISTMIRDSRSQVTNLENKLGMKELELDFIKNQLNPHFLFNSLNNISATIMVNKEIALDYTYKLSELLRYQVGISGRETVPVEEEIAFIRNFLDIEKFRLGGRCKINFTSKVEEPLVMIPPLLLHPLIERSLRKSLGLNGRSSINIQLTTTKELINLEIINSLPANPAYKKFSGTGLDILKKRLNLLFPGNYSLDSFKNKTENTLKLNIYLHKKKNNSTLTEWKI